MKARNIIMAALLSVFLVACGSLEKKAVLLNLGDTKEQVLAAMGPPDDRQLQGENEACNTVKQGRALATTTIELSGSSEAR